MPWSATTTSRTSSGSASRSWSASASIAASCCSHCGRVDAVLVAGPVEVAVVEVGQRRAVAEPGHRGGDPLADPVRADVAGTAVRGDGQPAAVELALVDHVDAHAGVGEPGEGGRVRLPLQRVDLLVPEQRVEQPVGARHPAGEADQPVRARGSARCRARSGWSRSSRARRRCRARCRRAARRGTAPWRRSAPAAASRARRRGTRRTPAPRAAPGRSGGAQGVAAERASRSPGRRPRARGGRRRARRSGSLTRPVSRRVGAGGELLGEGQQARRRRPGRRRRPRPAARSRRRPARRCSRGRPRTAGRRSRPAPGRPG